jgi:hypothetical protein
MGAKIPVFTYKIENFLAFHVAFKKSGNINIILPHPMPQSLNLPEAKTLRMIFKVCAAFASHECSL